MVKRTNVSYSQGNAALPGIGTTQATSEFSGKQTTLAAAMKSFEAVSQLSLFSLS